MLGNNEHTKFYVSNYGISGETGSSVYATNGKTIDDLTVGKVALVTLDNRVMDGSTTDTDGLVMKPSSKRYFRVAVKETATDAPRLSDVIDYTTIKINKAVASVDPKEKLAYLGYNGTSGAMENPVDTGTTDYIIRFTLKSELKATGDYPLIKVAAYRSTVTDGAKELTIGLYKSLVDNFEREKTIYGDQFVRFEVVSNGTFNTSVTTCTFVNGSKTVTGIGLGTAVAAVTPSGGVAGVNVPLRVNDATTTTTQVYFATFVDSATVTLTTAFQGVTGVYAAKVQTVDPTSYGIKFVGVPRKFSEHKPFKYQKADWEVQLVGFASSTTYTITQNQNKGQGTRERMAEIEYDLWQNEILAGNISIPNFYPKKNVTNGNLQVNSNSVGIPTDSSNATVLAAYDTWTLSWADKSTTNILTANQESPKELILACGYDSSTAAGLVAAIV